MRKSRDYEPSQETVHHIQAVMGLLKAMDRDHRFEENYSGADGKEDSKTMSEWLTRVINKSKAEGRAEGHAEGRAEGHAEGRAEGRAEDIRNIMEGLKLSAKQAMDILKIPPQEQEKYASML